MRKKLKEIKLVRTINKLNHNKKTNIEAGINIEKLFNWLVIESIHNNFVSKNFIVNFVFSNRNIIILNREYIEYEDGEFDADTYTIYFLPNEVDQNLKHKKIDIESEYEELLKIPNICLDFIERNIPFKIEINLDYLCSSGEVILFSNKEYREIKEKYL